MSLAVAQRTSLASFCAMDPSAPCVEAWAKAVPLETFSARPPGPRVVALYNGLDDIRLPGLLIADGRVVCATAVPPDRKDKISRLTARPCLFSLCVDTKMAMDVDISGAIRRSLEDNLQIPAQAADDIETCLHEAISNGLIHGNLGVGSQMRATPEAYLQYAALLEERLTDSARASRALYIRVVAAGGSILISVGDEGGGIPAGVRPITLADAGAQSSGRGLALIRTIAADLRHIDRGRICVMRFTIGDDE